MSFIIIVYYAMRQRTEIIQYTKKLLYIETAGCRLASCGGHVVGRHEYAESSDFGQAQTDMNRSMPSVSVPFPASLLLSISLCVYRMLINRCPPRPARLKSRDVVGAPQSFIFAAGVVTFHSLIPAAMWTNASRFL